MQEFLNNIQTLLINKDTLKTVLPSMVTSTATIINSLITIIVAIIGFSINTKINKRNLINEINKYKTSKHLEKLEEIPIELLNCINQISSKNTTIFNIKFQDKDEETLKKIKENNKQVSNKLRYIVDTIAGYGSKDSVKLVGDLNQLMINMKKEVTKKDIKDSGLMDKKIKVIAYLTLILCQVKFDLTGIAMNPELYYRCRINESYKNFGPIINNLKKFNNDIVKKLKLNKSFKIKSTKFKESKKVEDEYIKSDVKKAS